MYIKKRHILATSIVWAVLSGNSFANVDVNLSKSVAPLHGNIAVEINNGTDFTDANVNIKWFNEQDQLLGSSDELYISDRVYATSDLVKACVSVTQNDKSMMGCSVLADVVPAEPVSDLRKQAKTWDATVSDLKVGPFVAVGETVDVSFIVSAAAPGEELAEVDKDDYSASIYWFIDGNPVQFSADSTFVIPESVTVDGSSQPVTDESILGVMVQATVNGDFGEATGNAAKYDIDILEDYPGGNQIDGYTRPLLISEVKDVTQTGSNTFWADGSGVPVADGDVEGAYPFAILTVAEAKKACEDQQFTLANKADDMSAVFNEKYDVTDKWPEARAYWTAEVDPSEWGTYFGNHLALGHNDGKGFFTESNDPSVHGLVSCKTK